MERSVFRWSQHSQDEIHQKRQAQRKLQEEIRIRR